jgi:hypothetical protein
MTLPFFITFETASSELENIVDRALSVFEKIGNVQIPRQHMGAGPWKIGEFGSMSWYVQQALDPQRRQVQTDKLLSLFEREPYQKTAPHHELAVLDTDLFAPGTNFVYGVTRMKVSHTGDVVADSDELGNPRVTGLIQSTHRMKKWYAGDWKQAFFGILLHEMGHFYGLPDANSPSFLTADDPRWKGSLDTYHCNERGCIMEQVNIPGRLDLLSKARVVAELNPKWLCDHDHRALHKNLTRLYK